MKIAIRRHGVVVKTLELKDKKATIGSDPGSFIHLEDPYIASHVADLVLQDGDWRLVDTGLGLDGISRQGMRVIDEPILPGETYSVGAFEIIAEGFEVSPTTMAGMKSSQLDPSAVATKVESLDLLSPETRPGTSPPTNSEATPATVAVSFEELRGGIPAPEPEGKKTFRFAPVTGGGSEPAPVPLRDIPPVPQPMSQLSVEAAAPASGGGSKLRVILVVAVSVAVVLLLLAVAVSTLKPADEPKDEIVAPVETAPPVVTAAQLVAEGDAHAAVLEIDQAIEKWEEALTKGAGDDVRERYLRTAMSLARVHAARPDKATANRYFKKVIDYGGEGSPLVEEARARLANQP